jgi:hypothetical protein
MSSELGNVEGVKDRRNFRRVRGRSSLTILSITDTAGEDCRLTSAGVDESGTKIVTKP